MRHSFEFDAFRIEVEERRLLRNGQTVALTAKAFDVLVALLENRGQTVEKDDLIRAVWADTFVEEGNLNHHVASIRRVLGDDRREQRFIKTIPKRGYRFTAAVKEVVETSETLEIENVSRSKIVIREETSHGFWTTGRLALAGLLFVAVATIAWMGVSQSLYGGLAAAGRVSDADELYRRGRALWQTRDAGDLHEATALLEQAVATEPTHTHARAALADAYAFDYANWKKAEAEARETIRLDPSFGQPHATLGFVSMFWEWRVAEGEEHFKKAIALSPDYSTGRQWYALNLAAAGRADAALVEIEKALALEPHSIPINTDYCQILYFADRPLAAAIQCEKVLSVQPRSQDALDLLYQIAATRGLNDVAVGWFVASLANSKSERLRLEAQKFTQAYSEGGFERFRRAQIDFYTSIKPSPYKLARVLAETGDIDGAVESLKNALEMRDLGLLFYAADPALADVRISDRRHDLPGRPQ